MSQPLHFFGARFWRGTASEILREVDHHGGMIAVPSAPSLAQAAEDPSLMQAYRDADWCVMDGGYVATIVRLLGQSCPRISGLQLLENLLAPANQSPVPWRERRIFWVLPSRDEESRVRALLARLGFAESLQRYYLAPYYQEETDFLDNAALEQAVTHKAEWIVVCLGGGRQEKLARFLRQAWPADAPAPAILCTGAAIAFFSGGQASIPKWADRMYLGWLFRVCRDPSTFLPRYVKAAWHFPLALWRMRGKWFAPPSTGKTGSSPA